MRLLNVETLQLKEFVEREQPPYVITSHRWGDDETTYKDVRKGRNKDTAGFRKVQAFCSFVRQNIETPKGERVQWIWIDTCCIDKTSSAELTEAINSMFRWYAEAELCLAFLQDVLHLDTGPDEAQSSATWRANIQQSTWFTRGWTLQELLAPAVVLFVDQGWGILGHKGGRTSPTVLWPESSSLNDLISSVTGISSSILEDFGKAKDVSLEDKQRWMQNRQTTRVEDMAYCQLGIFNIFMPLIYGERDQAMERLRAEVKRKYGEELRDAASLNSEAAHTKDIPSASTQATASKEDGSQLEAIAQWDYEAREENEIDFHEGERITHIEKVDVDWWMGRNESGEEGLFPGDHVQSVEFEKSVAAAEKISTHEPADFRHRFRTKHPVQSIVGDNAPTSLKPEPATKDSGSEGFIMLYGQEANKEAVRPSTDTPPVSNAANRMYPTLHPIQKQDASMQPRHGAAATNTKPPLSPLERRVASLQTEDERAAVGVKPAPSSTKKRLKNLQAEAEKAAAARMKSTSNPLQQRAVNMRVEDEVAAAEPQPALNSLQKRVANVQTKDEAARLARFGTGKEPKASGLKAFRWLSNIFTLKEQPTDDDKRLVSPSDPPSEQMERERAQRQSARVNEWLHRTSKIDAPQPLNRRSTASSKASTSKERPLRKSRHAERRLKKSQAEEREVALKSAPGESSIPFSTAAFEAEVRYSYEAAEDNEISLHENELIRGIEEVDPGWWIGTKRSGQRGLFPSNYVQRLTANAKGKTPS